MILLKFLIYNKIMLGLTVKFTMTLNLKKYFSLGLCSFALICASVTVTHAQVVENVKNIEIPSIYDSVQYLIENSELDSDQSPSIQSPSIENSAQNPIKNDDDIFELVESFSSFSEEDGFSTTPAVQQPRLKFLNDRDEKWSAGLGVAMLPPSINRNSGDDNFDIGNTAPFVSLRLRLGE